MSQPTVSRVLEVAKQSECVRRKYGAVLWSNSHDAIMSTGWNARVTKCCDGICVRDRLSIEHGSNTDAGGEIHAEQHLIVRSTANKKTGNVYLAGLDRKGNLLTGFDCAPCYSCARMLRAWGFEYIFVPRDSETWESLSIGETMEKWEALWETDV